MPQLGSGATPVAAQRRILRGTARHLACCNRPQLRMAALTSLPCHALASRLARVMPVRLSCLACSWLCCWFDRFLAHRAPHQAADGLEVKWSKDTCPEQNDQLTFCDYYQRATLRALAGRNWFNTCVFCDELESQRNWQYENHDSRQSSRA